MINLQQILQDIRNGSLNLVYQNIGYLNQFASMFYQMGQSKTQLNNQQLDELECLIRICNIVYNCTDMNPLPIEDGVYDVILEYYKTYTSPLRFFISYKIFISLNLYD